MGLRDKINAVRTGKPATAPTSFFDVETPAEETKPVKRPKRVAKTKAPAQVSVAEPVETHNTDGVLQRAVERPVSDTKTCFDRAAGSLPVDHQPPSAPKTKGSTFIGRLQAAPGRAGLKEFGNDGPLFELSTHRSTIDRY